jgi:hypothetical protein
MAKKALGEAVAPLRIIKPSEGFLEKFRSKRSPSIGGVATLLTALPVLRIADANDFVRLHPSEVDYWSPELCFASVPIRGEKRDLLHLIDEELAMQHLNAKKIRRHRLALASKPHDNFFFCIVPSQNLDNPWNATTLKALEKGRTLWVQVSSRKEEGVEGTRPTSPATPMPSPIRDGRRTRLRN